MMSSLIGFGVASLVIVLMFWAVFRWGKTSQKKEDLDETVEIKDKQLRTRKPTMRELVDRLRKGGF